MSAKTGFRGLAGIFQKTMMVALVLVVVFSALPVGRAYAWGPGERQGTWGSVGYINMIDLGDMTQPYGTFFTVRTSTGPTVGRNPASSGTQTIYAAYALEQYVAPNWLPVKTLIHQTQIVGTWYSATLPAVRFELPVQSRGYFRVKFFIYWYATNGALLGAIEVLPNLASDFSCNYSSMRPCQTLPGSFRIGQYGTRLW